MSSNKTDFNFFLAIQDMFDLFNKNRRLKGIARDIAKDVTKNMAESIAVYSSKAIVTGMVEGKEIGIAEGKIEMLKIVIQNAFTMNMSIADIEKLTDLTQNEIQTLRKEVEFRQKIITKFEENRMLPNG